MRLSQDFHLDEFDCHDGTPVPYELQPVLQILVEGVLQPIRERVGVPVFVISGYRTPDYNRRIGGAALSTHVSAAGADIRTTVDAVKLLHHTIKTMWEKDHIPALGGLGLYRTWVHVDTRKAADGHLREWSGRGVGSEQ